MTSSGLISSASSALHRYAASTIPHIISNLSRRLERSVTAADNIADASKLLDCGSKGVGFQESATPVQQSQLNSKGKAREDRELSCLYEAQIPSMEIRAYLFRIVTYTPIPLDAILVAMLYLHRLTSALSTPTSRDSLPSVSSFCITREHTPPLLNSLTVHRYVLAVMTIATKFISDIYICHERAAKVGGLYNSELRDLEIEILKLLEFRLMWSYDEIEVVAKVLMAEVDADEEIALPATVASEMSAGTDVLKGPHLIKSCAHSSTRLATKNNDTQVKEASDRDSVLSLSQSTSSSTTKNNDTRVKEAPDRDSVLSLSQSTSPSPNKNNDTQVKEAPDRDSVLSLSQSTSPSPTKNNDTQAKEASDRDSVLHLPQSTSPSPTPPYSIPSTPSPAASPAVNPLQRYYDFENDTCPIEEWGTLRSKSATPKLPAFAVQFDAIESIAGSFQHNLSLEAV